MCRLLPRSAVIGVKAPQALCSAADVPDLHRAWLFALAAGWVAVTDGKVVARSTTLPGQDAEVLLRLAGCLSGVSCR